MAVAENGHISANYKSGCFNGLLLPTSREIASESTHSVTVLICMPLSQNFLIPGSFFYYLLSHPDFIAMEGNASYCPDILAKRPYLK